MTINPPQRPSAPWEARAAEKRTRCADAIPKLWRLPSSVLDTLQTPLETSKNDLVSLDIPRRSGILTDLELDITEHYNVSDLLAKLADGSFTAAQVVTAFSKRAAIAQQLTNCLTETFFDQAESRAQQLDKLRQDGKLAGPLHGLPVTTIGLVAYLDEFSKTNSPLVEILLSLGAVPFVKTNVPQTMMTADSHNNVFGRTLNPRNTALGAGGSSGGEGALIAFRGAPIGVGTDIAGSIRIPSLCCGTYGFKPTAARIPYGGQRGCSNPGLKFILACAGPLANDMQSLEIFTKAVIDSRPADLDSTAIDVPWRNIPAFEGKRLRLGVLPEDPSYPLHPPVRNAISQAVAKLRAEGHILVDLDPQECLIDGINDVAWGFFAFDNTASRIVTDAGEPVIPSRQRIADELKRLKSDYLPDLTGLSDLDKLATLNIKKAAAVEGWRRIWQSHRLDAVIGPSAQNTAVQHDLYGVPPYTCFLNVLNYPACIIPFGNAKQAPGEDFALKSGQAGPPYDAELTEGAPCSVQVFTSSMRDEECIAVSSTIDKILNC
ncbi:hypothetical protein LCI18_003622 [Fusarium solani-melongenae]|uniref:Uncharacterized protein n=1 Tax=Fusarium solani subsp. cucurbitae TaxID=2747967 RepID=A0ACD3YUN2_FUSSC|nr:hypothetical protein LCI18_003622 [Fusarium solani-melongenae]